MSPQQQDKKLVETKEYENLLLWNGEIHQELLNRTTAHLEQIGELPSVAEILMAIVNAEDRAEMEKVRETDGYSEEILIKLWKADLIEINGRASVAWVKDGGKGRKGREGRNYLSLFPPFHPFLPFPLSQMKRYEQIDHTADLKIRAYGVSLPELFENAALGMLEAIAVVDSIDEVVKIKIEVESDTLEDLLVAWLSEIHFQHEVQEVLFKRAKVVRFDENKVIGFAYGEEINPDKHEMLTEIKSVTYHQLEVEEYDDGIYEAQVIFDL